MIYFNGFESSRSNYSSFTEYMSSLNLEDIAKITIIDFSDVTHTVWIKITQSGPESITQEVESWLKKKRYKLPLDEEQIALFTLTFG